MTEQLSALMDGELDSAEAEGLIKRLPADAALVHEWALYHVIGESLRQERVYPINVVSTVGRRLGDEPTVLAPPRRRTQRYQVYALSAAASVVAVAMVAWIMLQGQAPSTALPMAQAPGAAAALVMPVSATMNDYLRAHQEYSPSTQILGVAPYVRTVSGEPDRDLRR
ncbi:MAG: sigma-E factor negative regulatory protein [Pseudomonadota bacterium]